MNKIKKFVFGAMIGGFVGSAIVILLAPESGEETRTAFSLRLENLVKQIGMAIDERKKELNKEFENYKNSSI